MEPHIIYWFGNIINITKPQFFFELLGIDFAEIK